MRSVSTSLLAIGALLAPAAGQARPAEAGDAVTCGGVAYAVPARRETPGRPGLAAPRLFADGALFAESSEPNGVARSALPVARGHDFHPVADTVGVFCRGDAPVVLARVLYWGDLEQRRGRPFPDYAADDVLTPDPALGAETGDGEWLFAGEYVTFEVRPDRKRRHELVPGERFTFAVTIDPSLGVRLPEVEGFEEGDPPRPAGRIDLDGEVNTFVEDELTIATDAEDVDDLLARRGATLVDLSPPNRDGRRAALVRVAPEALAAVDTTDLAAQLLLGDPDLRGTLAFSSARMAQLFMVAALEANEHGTVVAPNVLSRADGIADGFTTEGDPAGGATPDAFSWNFMTDGAGMDTGVGRAWQVMEATVGFDEKVGLMVVDGGFQSNFDMPPGTILRKTEWGATNPVECGGNPCPWHGTASWMTAAALVDNGYGTAGPAGPVARLVLVGMGKDQYTTMRRARDMVEEYRPRIVSMSFSGEFRLFRAAAEALHDVYLGRMTELGALLFGSSGNDGRDMDAVSGNSESVVVLPCESRHVVCVGGETATGAHNTAAAFGTALGDRTVELVGPYCVYGLNDPGDITDFGVRTVCGTSEATPFVAGVAALMMSANPSLTGPQVREILYATAHTGAPFVAPIPGGYTRRLDAFAAVLAALDLELEAPAVQILAPAPNSQHAKGDAIDARAVATDTFGRPLTITWRDGNKVLGTSASGALTPLFPAPGLRTLRAEATDFRGATTQATVQVQVGAAPQLHILAPGDGEDFYDNVAVPLAAQTFDPDTNGPIADDDVIWNVRLNGADVFATTGHAASIPAAVLGPGTYDLFVDAIDEEGVASEHLTFTVVALPPGEFAPIAEIVQPVVDLQLLALNGVPQMVHFEGEGLDPGFGDLPGTRFRWTALSDAGTKKTLCEGHQVPGSGDGGIVLPKDCSEFDAAFGIDGGTGVTRWLVTLEVYDMAGLKGVATRDIEVILLVP
jgi:subtilisin family serine protease